MSVAKRYTGRIYHIINDIDNEAYIGSTTQRLSVRMGTHRRNAKNGSKHPVYVHMRKIGIEHFKIFLLQHIDKCTKEELKALENQYYTQVNNIQKKYKPPQCKHNKRKSQCVKCIGSEICEHKRVRTHCVQCEGASICRHKRIRNTCKICNPYECKICNRIYGGKSNYNKHSKTKMHLKNLEKL